ncbi:MAG TPA: hypothetical protein EYO33_20850 [Phycisphaerales bacterium]|nr:hypothetical protein [Phycisphaerales bacterium]
MKNLDDVETSLNANSEEAQNIAKNDPDPEIFPDVADNESLDSTQLVPQKSGPELSNIIKLSRLSTGTMSGMTGAMGLAGQIIDIPGLYSLSLLHLSRIATAYGYDPTQKEERDFMLSILTIAHLPTESARREALVEVHEPSATKTYAGEIGAAFASRSSVISIYKLAARFFTSRFRFLVPVVGALANLTANMRFMEALTDTAVRAYSRRASLRESLEAFEN